MNVSKEFIRKKLTEKGLKVALQRLSILEAVFNLKNHRTAENIMEYIHETHPNIATGTVYKVLETLVESKLIVKVKTDRDLMRYDGIIENHHHLYSSDNDLIEDYFDEELDELLMHYFEKKQLKGFKIENVVLQIKGTFDKN